MVLKINDSLSTKIIVEPVRFYEVITQEGTYFPDIKAFISVPKSSDIYYILIINKDIECCFATLKQLEEVQKLLEEVL